MGRWPSCREVSTRGRLATDRRNLWVSESKRSFATLRYSLNCLNRLKSEGRKQKIRLIILSHRNYFAILKRLILKEVPIKLNIYSPLQLYLVNLLLIDICIS